MGGYGSGRRSWRGVLEGCRRLDVNRFQRERMLSGHGSTLWGWFDEDGTRQASILVRRLGHGLELSYTVSPGTEEEQHVQYEVGLAWTLCHYGGERPWFICPNQRCRRRVGVLYLWGRYFICRHCTGAAYASQNETQSDRLARKARRVRTKLGASMNLFESLGDWDKPKGMHWRTFRRLQRQEMWASHDSLILAARRLGIYLDRP